MQPPDHFLLIEPDEELRKILAAEIARAVKFPVQSCGIGRLPEDGRGRNSRGCCPIVKRRCGCCCRRERNSLTLQLSSVPTSLAGLLPAPAGLLVGVASRWPEFLKVARAVLNAAGFHPDSLVFRDARESNWQRGFKQTAAVVCDSLTAAELAAGMRAIPFSLLSESSVEELRRYEEFIRQPMV